MAVRLNPIALRFIHIQTPKICIEAIKKDVGARCYVKNMYPEIRKVIDQELNQIN